VAISGCEPDLAAAIEAAPLDLHEGIATGGCDRWPEHLRLLNQATGELLPGRCRATNLCRYCQTFYVIETVEMLTLDAVEYAPTLWLVLTAREHLTRKTFNAHLKHLRRVARRTWPLIEWFVQVEFQRRGALHGNLLIKGVPIEQRDELHQVLVTEWCARVDAEPVGQWSGVIEDGVGVVRYLQKTLSHGLKREQAPPIGWRGHRTSQTRGYLVRPASVMRAEAKRSLRLKRKLWRGLSLEVAQHELAEDEQVAWSIHSTLSGRDVDRERAESARAPFRDLRSPTNPDREPRATTGATESAPAVTSTRASRTNRSLLRPPAAPARSGETLSAP